MIKYDIGIIGSGSAGSTVAHGLKAAGKTVAIFEDYLWGGTCANYGCDPKKILVNSVDVIRHARLFENEVSGTLAVNWPAIMAKKNAYVSKHPANTIAGLKAAHIETYSETPRFINQDTVELSDGTKIQANKWVIATGKRPVHPEFTGAQLAGTSEDFLKMMHMPTDITFIGGGYIAVEFASIAQLAGANVRILQHNDRILKGFDQWMVEKLVPQLQADGIAVQFNTEVASLAKRGDRILVTTTDGAEFETDQVIAAVGRVASVAGLDLERAGVALEKNGITVNDYLQTTNPNIYAVGDVAASGTPNLTPVAGYEGRYLVTLLTEDNVKAITYPKISTAVFAHPRIAQVGVTTVRAKELGYKITDYDLSTWFNYMRLNDNAAARIVMDGDKIVGASLISESADEIINMFVHAINHEWTLADIKRQIMTYPTMESDLQYFF